MPFLSCYFRSTAVFSDTAAKRATAPRAARISARFRLCSRVHLMCGPLLTGLHLQGPALAAYDEVFAREPSHTKHIQQDVTPALLAPIKPKVYVD